MRTNLITGTLIGLLACTVGAEEFYLQHDDTSKLHGPYQSTTGSKVSIGSVAFTVVPSKAASTVEKRLSQVNLRQIDLRGASLGDSLKFLGEYTQQLDPKGDAIDFVVVQPRSQSRQKPTDPFSAPSGGRRTREARVNLQLRDVSAFVTLKLMMAQTGATYKISGNTVTIYPKS